MPVFRRTVTREAQVTTPLLLRVDCSLGRVRVTGADQTKATVRAELEVHAESQEEADREVERVERGITFQESTLTVESPRGEGEWFFWWRRLKVEYEIQVPTQTRAEVRVVNGPLEVYRIAGPLRSRTTNGPVRVEDVNDSVEAEATNGPLSLHKCHAKVDVRLVNGPLRLDESTGPARLQVTNGSCFLERIASGVEARVLNGPIDYRGGIGGDFDLECTAGIIRLHVPKRGRFEIDAQSHFGNVSSDLPVRESAVEGNGPVPKVRLRTRFGAIRIAPLD